MEVKWKLEGIYKADAQKCYAEIGERNITPEQLVEIARNEKTELHKCFEWDDSVAAEKFRLEQAAKVIRMFVVVPQNVEQQPVRVFQISTEKSVYMPTKMIIQNDDEYDALRKRAFAELKSFRERYKTITELEEVFNAIDSL